MSTLLDIQNLSVAFDTDEGTLTAAENVSFSIGQGEVVGLVGESGCGKSVTALSLLRLIPMPPGRILSGKVLFEGRDLLRLPASELQTIRGRRISVIFQEPQAALSPLHTIGAQLIETLQLHLNIDHQSAKNISLDWLRKVGLPDPEERMRAYPYQLSGGMLQRVMIAMALMLEPSLIIADEPTTALDVTIQAQILDLLLEMKSKDTSLLIITHDLGVVWEMCDRILVMYAAKIVEEGPRHDLFKNPAHPYTQALLESVISLTSRSERLSSIEGQVPSPLAYPAGCRFADRCKYAFPRCRQELPPLYNVTPNHRSACFLSETSDLKSQISK
ncbi:MAG: ABC transporter ATP-binding protein [bacterium]|jgi:oligopeptide/dipeptide ABC transporter ATP-binding protein